VPPLRDRVRRRFASWAPPLPAGFPSALLCRFSVVSLPLPRRFRISRSLHSATGLPHRAAPHPGPPAPPFDARLISINPVENPSLKLT